jgi:hypothetical protein
MNITATSVRFSLQILLCFVLTVTVACGDARAEDAKTSIALGKFTITAPKQWERKQPRSRIITYEFAVPAVEGDEQDGRLTVMAAGGSIDDNIKRWYGQFKQPDGSSTEKNANVEEKEITGQKVHLVDLAGTFSDRPGPAFPAVEREDYRMLAAIIVTDEAQFFIKLYGPRKTVGENKEPFETMIESLSAE